MLWSFLRIDSQIKKNHLPTSSKMCSFIYSIAFFFCYAICWKTVKPVKLTRLFFIFFKFAVCLSKFFWYFLAFGFLLTICCLDCMVIETVCVGGKGIMFLWFWKIYFIAPFLYCYQSVNCFLIFSLLSCLTIHIHLSINVLVLSLPTHHNVILI